MTTTRITAIGVLAAIWSISGLMLLLIYASWRLSAYTYASLQMPLNWVHWVVLIGWGIFMIHGEGYKGFQKKFSPRFAARTKYLSHNSTFLQLLLAPLFSMAYFHAPKKRVIATVALTIMIVAFILAFRYVPQPWKGLLDAGVVAGLIWGTFSTAYYCYKAFTDENFDWDPELPKTLVN